MSKRKRNSEPSLQEQLTKSQDDLFRALKAAKGFERQRLSKRLHEAGITPDKQERLGREVAVLKSLELHQTARAHLFSSLLKVKAIAASTDLPDEIRTGVPKPELSEEERSALHNVTSGLYNRKPVKDVVDRAIETVCKLLKVPVPSKGKQGKKDKRKDEEDQPADRIPSKAEDEVILPPESGDGEGEDGDEVTDFEGFGTDNDKPGPALAPSESDSEEEDAEENEFAEYDHLLGSSSEDEDRAFNDKIYEQFRGREKVNLDDISISGSDADVEAGEESEEDEEEEEDDDDDEAESDQSASPQPPPAKKKKRSKEEAESRAIAKAGPIRDSTFLPSLMGGYISGSESASDVDVEAPKKRRGQRARQAIWEKKFGAKAKHLQREKKKGGRDAGWDMRRGAVDGDDQGRRTPWKKGVSNPFLNKGRGDGDGSNFEEKPPPKPTKRDDEGVLHPSWEAAKKAKDAQKALAFSGAKIVFD